MGRSSLVRTTVALGLASAALAGAGCGDDGDGSTATVTIQQSGAQETRQVSVGVSETATVLLPENPTTGYELEVQREPDESIATATEAGFEQSGPEAEGTGGFHAFDIEGKAAGRTSLVVRAIGPGGERGDEYTVAIVVR